MMRDVDWEHALEVTIDQRDRAVRALSAFLGEEHDCDEFYCGFAICENRMLQFEAADNLIEEDWAQEILHGN